MSWVSDTWNSVKKEVKRSSSKVVKEAKRGFNNTVGAVEGGVLAGMIVPGLGHLYGAAAGWQMGAKEIEGVARDVRDQVMGKQPEVEVPSWTDTQSSISNEGVSNLENSEEKRKRVASSYSLSKTRSGRVLGGNLGGGGTGGSSSRKSGGTV